MTYLFYYSYLCNSRLVLRILTDDSSAQCQLGLKYGCHTKHAPYLLEKARELGLDVVGVSFHVGSGCRDARTFGEAIQDAKDLMGYGTRLGYRMNMLDIGGGYPGQASANIPFEEVIYFIAVAIRDLRVWISFQKKKNSEALTEIHFGRFWSSQ